ncbi:MAG: FMN-binding protein [Eggerthellaceae bacterium]
MRRITATTTRRRNIAECIVFGKISGENAAAAKDDALDRCFETRIRPHGTQSVYDQTPDVESRSKRKGRYREGLGGPIWVKVSLDGSSIANVEIIRATETEGVGDPALDSLPACIVEAGGTDVDAIAGATVTSAGIIQAVENALES